jgi:hypothetical protein
MVSQFRLEPGSLQEQIVDEHGGKRRVSVELATEGTSFQTSDNGKAD